MALIKCPECNKEVSDRAHSCPFCGFPLDEYFMEIEEEKTKAEEERIEEEKKQNNLERKKQYSEKKQFPIFGKQIYIDENDRICSYVGFTFQCVQEKLHEELQRALLSSDTPSDYNKKKFPNYANSLLSMFRDEILNRACFIADKFIDKDSEAYEFFEEEISESVDLSSFFQVLCEKHSKFYSDYDLNVDNAHVQYYDDYYAAGKPAKPIDEVYSDTLLGMIGPGIAARLINGAVGAISNGIIKPKEHAASNKFYNTVLAEKLKLDAQVLSVADGFIDKIVSLYKESVLNYLLESNTIFEIIDFPKNGYDYKNIMDYLSDEERTNDIKKAFAVNNIENIPADFSIYAMVLATMDYTVDDVTEIRRIIDYFDVLDEVRNALRDFGSPAINLLGLEEVTEGDIKAATVASRTLNKRQFSSVEEKELYIKEEKLYSSYVKKFLDDTYWYNKENLSIKCKALQKMDRLTFKEWQEDYDSALKLAGYLKGKDVGEPMSKIAPFISFLTNMEKLAYSFSVREFRNNGWKENEWLKECVESLEADELPIIVARHYAEKLVITTRYFYYCQKSKLVKKFGLDEIDQVSIRRKTFIDPAAIFITISDDATYQMFSNNVPDDIFNVLSQFAENLKRYVEKNPSRNNKHLSAVLENTPYVGLTEEGLTKQIDYVAKIKHLIFSMPSKDTEYRLMKWTYEVDSVLGEIVTKNKIGHEYILYYDRHYIVTEQAVYCKNKHDDSGTSFERYAFEEYAEFFPVILNCSYYTEYCLLFVNKKKKPRPLSFSRIKPVSINEFKNVILAINIVLNKEKIDTGKSLCNRNVLFCSSCCKVYEEYDGKMKKCLDCGGKMVDVGWKNTWDHDKYYDLHRSLEEGGLNRVKEFLSTDIDTIRKLAEMQKLKCIEKEEAERRKKEEKEQKKKEKAELKRQEAEKQQKEAIEGKQTEEIESKQQDEKLVQSKVDTDAEMFCPYCGKRILRKVKFCNFCGKQNNYRKGL